MPHHKTSKRVQWDSSSVRALRQHLGATQQELSEELGVRQQTVSEWELGKYQPRGACARVLTMVAERTRFSYEVNPSDVIEAWQRQLADIVAKRIASADCCGDDLLDQNRTEARNC